MTVLVLVAGLALLVCAAVFRARHIRRAARLGLGAAAGGLGLTTAAGRLGDAGDLGPALRDLGVVLVLPAVLVAAGLSVTLAGRLLTALTSGRRPPGAGPAPRLEPADVVPPESVIGRDGTPYPGAGLCAPRPDRDLDRPPAALGLCVSGGGIRSATVTLGALQVLRRAGILRRARYLVAVSGGGFTAGAFQLAMTDPPSGSAASAEAVTDPGRVFEEGSVEEDHLRRHGTYVADSAAEWVVALATVLRGALASLALLAGVVSVAGVVLGVVTRVGGLAAFDYGYPFSPGAGPRPPAFPPVADHVVLAVALTVGAGVLGWFADIAVMSYRGAATRIGRSLVLGAFSLAGGVVALGVLLPAVVWGGTRVIWWVDSVGSVSAAQVVTGGAIGAVALAYLGSLNSILGRGRRQVARLAQRVVVQAVLVAVAALYALLLGAVVRAASRPGVLEAPVGAWGWWPQWFLVGVCGGFVLVAALVDETWMSLHWFYRRRLARAFAVRRIRLGEGCEAAVPYDFEHEPTPLSTYAAKKEGFPQVIFSGAAHLSGADRTPPGRDAVSFTFAADWVGGPQVGYVRTAALEENLGTNLRLDVTVQTAMAVSGAAFASAMGVQARAYQTLLALSNARLGTWLPNPAWLHRRCRAGAPDWTRPRLPRVRRISYLLREVVGHYDQRDRLLLVTDGGHYDNTGLVELLRHRCRTVVLVDSSGDAPPLCSALGRAISLAREELDVRIDLDDPLALVPGSGAPLQPAAALADVNARLSRASVVTGTITYPEPFRCGDGDEPAPGAVGRLVVAKVALTADLPYDVLAFAAANPAFPFDSTGDQWFDEGQFNAYHALGRALGEHVAVALAEPDEICVKLPEPRVAEEGEVRLA